MVLLPLWISEAGILASMVGFFAVRCPDHANGDERHIDHDARRNDSLSAGLDIRFTLEKVFFVKINPSARGPRIIRQTRNGNYCLRGDSPEMGRLMTPEKSLSCVMRYTLLTGISALLVKIVSE